VATAGEVYQRPYDPFRTPNRARAEELGDVLAEGLYWLLDQDRSLADADRQHWAMFLTNREQFIKRVIHMVACSRLQPSEKRRRIAALNGSLQSLSLISPSLCQMYLRAWVADRERWRRHLDSVPKGLTRRQALNWLKPEAPVMAVVGSGLAPARIPLAPALLAPVVAQPAEAVAGGAGRRRIWSPAGWNRSRSER
jgi:hypothetical protein